MFYAVNTAYSQAVKFDAGQLWLLTSMSEILRIFKPLNIKASAEYKANTATYSLYWLCVSVEPEHFFQNLPVQASYVIRKC